MKPLLAKVIRKSMMQVLPESKHLALISWLYLHDAECEGELKYIDRIIGERKTAIDVGANDGLYSFAMSKHFDKVISFEINDAAAKPLRDYNASNVEIINKGLSSQNQNVTLYVPVLNGLPLTGWASLEPGNSPDTQQHLEIPVQVCVLDDYNLADVSFIKIDVEGHELEVLRGAKQTLCQNRPVILVEIKDRNVGTVTSFMSDLGFKKHRLRDLIGMEGSPENYIFTSSASHA